MISIDNDHDSLFALGMGNAHSSQIYTWHDGSDVTYSNWDPKYKNVRINKLTKNRCINSIMFELLYKLSCIFASLYTTGSFIKANCDTYPEADNLCSLPINLIKGKITFFITI